MSNDQEQATPEAAPSSDIEVQSTDRTESAKVAKEESPASTEETQEDESSSEEQVEASEASADDAESDDESADEDDDLEEGDKPKKRTGRQKRISKLIKQRAEAEAKAKYLEEQLAKYQKPQGQEAKSEEPKKQASERPSPDDYDTQEDYIEAVADWKFEQRRQKDEQKKAQENQLTEYQQTVASFRDKAIAFGKTQENYNEVMAEIGDINPSLTVQQAWFDAGEDGPALMFEMAKDPEEFERICNLPPIAAARAIGKIEARLSKESSPQPKKEIKTTKAPKPVSPVGTKSTGTSAKSLATADYEDYRRIRMEQMQQNRR